MKKRISLFTVLAAMILTIFFVASPAYAQIADGTYELNYEMKEASSENTSIADGYFAKPAKLTVENGVQQIQLTVTGSSMIKSLSTPAGPVTVVSEDTANETRTVKFTISGDLSQPLNMNMHIIVPDLYDQEHTARAVFNVSGLPQASQDTAASETAGATDTAENGNGTGEAVENPKTGENSSMALYGLLMAGALVGLFAIWKFRPARD